MKKNLLFWTLAFSALCAGEQNTQNEQNMQRWLYEGYLRSSQDFVFLDHLKIPVSLYEENIKAHCALNSPCKIEVSFTEIEDIGPHAKQPVAKIHSAKAVQTLKGEIKIESILLDQFETGISGQMNGAEVWIDADILKIKNLKTNEIYSIECSKEKATRLDNNIKSDGERTEGYERFYLIDIKDKK